MKKLLLCAAALLCAAVLLLAAALAFWPGQALEAGRRLRRWEAGLATRDVRAAGHRIAYLEGGSGEPLVLLHGFGADKDSWPPLARLLARRFHLYAPDLPGFGESTRDPAVSYGFAEQAERVEAFARAVGLDAPFHLAGHSMGGGIAGIYTARYPNRVKTLWLIAPAGVSTAAPSELVKRVIAGENPLIVTTAEDFDALMALLFVEPPWIPPLVGPVLARSRAAHRDFDRKVFGDLRFRAVALEAELRGSTVPTFILWGDRDRVLDVSGAAILGDVMLGATVSILPGAGHVPMIEAPRAAAERYLAFQQGVR
jgi:pimeloyl-ACP methyl ester carboxylesterase